MHSELFSVGPFTVYSYGLMIAIGMVAAVMITMKRCEARGLNADHLFNMGMIGIVSGVIGAKLMYYLVELPSVIAHPAMLLDLSNGFVVYGGALGVITPAFYCRKFKLSYLRYVDMAVPTIALAQGFGRIGCFLAGCCYGAPTTQWYGVIFPVGSLAPYGVPLIPTQLISSALDFLHALILFWYTGKKMDEKRPIGSGLALYAILYPIGRFLVEFLRADPRGSVGILSTSQAVSIGIEILGILLMVFFLKQGKRMVLSENVSKDSAESVTKKEK